MRPDPTVRVLTVIPGEVTVTAVFAPGRCRKPGIAAETVVVPAPTGSNATPPAATDCGETYWPTGIVTVVVPVVPPVVCSWPTPTWLLATDTVSGMPPARTTWPLTPP